MKQRFARLVLKLMRWTPVGPAPEAKKYIMLSAPHTTNWDLPALLVATWSQGQSVNFLGKHQLFRGPMNWLMRSLGGIPVRREGRHGMVESLTAEFAAADEIALAIPAAGTRSYSDHWKSGFYRIALAAEVPIVCAFVDYKTKTLGFGPAMTPTGDPDVDIVFFQDFYADMVGKFPEKKSEIRFRPDQTKAES